MTISLTKPNTVRRMFGSENSRAAPASGSKRPRSGVSLAGRNSQPVCRRCANTATAASHPSSGKGPAQLRNGRLPLPCDERGVRGSPGLAPKLLVCKSGQDFHQRPPEPCQSRQPCEPQHANARSRLFTTWPTHEPAVAGAAYVERLPVLFVPHPSSLRPSSAAYCLHHLLDEWFHLLLKQPGHRGQGQPQRHQRHDGVDAESQRHDARTGARRGLPAPARSWPTATPSGRPRREGPGQNFGRPATGFHR